MHEGKKEEGGRVSYTTSTSVKNHSADGLTSEHENIIFIILTLPPLISGHRFHRFQHKISFPTVNMSIFENYHKAHPKASTPTSGEMGQGTPTRRVYEVSAYCRAVFQGTARPPPPLDRLVHA